MMAAVLTMSSFIPQINKALRTRRMNDVSTYLKILFIGGFSLWVVYGILRSDLIIIGANVMGVAFNVFLLILKSKFTSNRKDRGSK
jgi:MtN3 and saliva related transmembrane protein